MQQVQITTDRLILREFVADDWEAVLAYQSDPLYLRYYVWESRTEGDVRGFIQMFLNQQSEEPRRKFQFAITLPGNGTIIGNCGIRVTDSDLRQANIGYEMDPRHWGNGYATEAARAILRLGFAKLEMHRITADCLAANVASVQVLEKIGMRRELCQREKESFKGHWWDGLQYAILDRDWLAHGREE